VNTWADLVALVPGGAVGVLLIIFLGLRLFRLAVLLVLFLAVLFGGLLLLPVVLS
jgi:hypothetical protein